eukprot:6179742-Pleurochrysis_carterae.AAC.3
MLDLTGARRPPRSCGGAVPSSVMCAKWHCAPRLQPVRERKNLHASFCRERNKQRTDHQEGRQKAGFCYCAASHFRLLAAKRTG